MHITIIGSGGREHALAWKIKQSPQCTKLSTLPGNGGTEELGENVLIKAGEIDQIVDWCVVHKPDLVVIGPEDPLSLGLVDALQKKNIPAFGPHHIAAQMESSKAWSKQLMLKHKIPTGFAEIFDDYNQARKFIEQHDVPLVVKADGLAAGKGVYICSTLDHAYHALEEIMQEKKYGKAGSTVLIEEFLQGREVSYLTFVDSKSIVPMRSVCDYKRIFDHDEGPNTGGMGVYSPPSFVSPSLLAEVQKTIAQPTLEALQKENIEYNGVLYIGLILTKNGPKVLEYNARFGDPETQVIVPALQTDLVEIMQACAEGRLEEIDFKWSEHAFCGVVMASGGYPGSYEKGHEISKIDQVKEAIVFQAGTKKIAGKLVTDGGRVLCVVGEGEDMQEAREKAYQGVQKISFPGAYYRKDIALREIS